MYVFTGIARELCSIQFMLDDQQCTPKKVYDQRKPDQNLSSPIRKLKQSLTSLTYSSSNSQLQLTTIAGKVSSWNLETQWKHTTKKAWQNLKPDKPSCRRPKWKPAEFAQCNSLCQLKPPKKTELCRRGHSTCRPLFQTHSETHRAGNVLPSIWCNLFPGLTSKWSCWRCSLIWAWLQGPSHNYMIWVSCYQSSQIPGMLTGCPQCEWMLN